MSAMTSDFGHDTQTLPTMETIPWYTVSVLHLRLVCITKRKIPSKSERAMLQIRKFAETTAVSQDTIKQSTLPLRSYGNYVFMCKSVLCGSVTGVVSTMSRNAKLLYRDHKIESLCRSDNLLYAWNIEWYQQSKLVHSKTWSHRSWAPYVLKRVAILYRSPDVAEQSWILSSMTFTNVSHASYISQASLTKP